MKPAIPLVEAAREVESVLAEAGFPSVIIGGLAVFRWGEPRLTRDVDFTVLCPWGEEVARVDAILSRLDGRIPDAAEAVKGELEAWERLAAMRGQSIESVSLPPQTP